MSLILDHTLGKTTIERWTEKSANADFVQGVKARQPELKQSTAFFDGEDDWLVGEISDNFNTEQCSVYVVGSCSSQTGTHVLASFYASGQEGNDSAYLRIGYEDGKPTAWYGNGTDTTKIQGTVEDNSYMHVLSFHVRPSDGRRSLHKGVARIAESTTDRSIIVDTLKMGGYGAGNASLVELRNVASYDGYHEEAERSQIITHLRGRYIQSFGGPIVRDGAITLNSKFHNEVGFQWEEAADDVTPRNALMYSVYRSTTGAITSQEDIDNHATEILNNTNNTSVSALNLNPGTQYYFNIVVEDAEGNKTFFDGLTVTTEEIPESVSPFVTTTGTNFIKDGNPYKFAGTNAYYLVQYEKINSTVVDDALDAFETAGIEVIRMWGFYNGAPRDSNGNDPTLQPNRGEWNETDLRHLDSVMAKCADRGITIVFSLLNYWQQLGGVVVYNEWNGESNPDGADKMHKFINGPQTEWFKDYIEMILNRTNTVTGVQYKNDPTVFAWEIINEARNAGTMGGTNLERAEELRDWYQEIAQFIKGIDSNHLVTTGEEGFDIDGTDAGTPYQEGRYSNTYILRANQGTSYVRNTQIPEIDFGQYHTYMQNFGFSTNYTPEYKEAMLAFIEDHHHIAESAGKPAISGEYGVEAWGDARAMDMYPDFWGECEAEGVQGTLLWQFTHNHVKCYEYGGNICYPAGRIDTEEYNAFVNHIDNMKGADDATPPVISDGALTTSSVDVDGMTINFTKANDAVSNTLTYELYYSSTNNIDTVANARNNGTLAARNVGVSSLDITGLTGGENVYVQVLAIDAAGNASAYTSRAVSTAVDNTAPTTADAALTASSIGGTSFNANFTQAEDNISEQRDIKYTLYTSISDNLDTVSNIEANGTEQASDTGVTRLRASGLSLSTTYYYNIIAQDASGNKVSYSSNSLTTLSEAVAELTYEWDEAGLTIANGNEIDDWTDNIQGTSLQETSSDTRLLWDSVNKLMYADNNNRKAFNEGINIMTDEFMLSVVIDFSTLRDQFRGILRLAPSDGGSEAEGGLYIGNDAERAQGFVANVKYQGANLGGDGYLTHDNKLSVVTVRVTGGMAEALIECADDTSDSTSSNGLSVPNSPVTRISLNARILIGGGIEAYTGADDFAIRAIRMWNTPGDTTTRDNRIAQMRTDYNV